HPSKYLSVGDIVTVWVVEVDAERGRIGLSLIKPDGLD
ncbi:TPA: transcriptional accessory protein, partial [Streptococcus agalactiae]|nr:transcriptional accessory protein [Streptococcus agalactiae]